jgi:hypothetical protein
MTRALIGLVGMGLLMGGCPMDSDDDKETADTGDSAAATAAVSGTVSRTAPLAADGDGVGTLYVAAFQTCSHDGTVIGAAIIPGADLSSEAGSVPFSIAGLPPGPVHLALFLDDDGNADPGAPLPDEGDLVYGVDAGDGVLNCVEVDLSAGDVSGVALELNLLEEAVPATLSGTVSRTAPIAPEGDGIGLLLVAVLETCDVTAPVILGTSVTPNADLSSDSAAVPFSIAGLPRTTVYVGLFLDDNGNADPKLPLPDAGDLVYGFDALDGEPDCVEVDLSAGDVSDQALELNLLEE